MNQILQLKLQDQQHPLIRQLADAILSTWEHFLDLSPYQTPPDLGYIEGKLEGDRLIIQNHCYQTPQFRKLHLELAKVGENLDILHCVMFPKLEYTLPMFGCDLVAGKGRVSAAIADLSPLNSQRRLGPHYQEQLQRLPLVHFQEVRELPAWGDIFSEFCLFIRPTTPEEEADFLARTIAMLKLHCQIARQAQPVSEADQQANFAGQHYYCTKQRQNDKTRRVLEKAFGVDWAEYYMNSMLFDLPTLITTG